MALAGSSDKLNPFMNLPENFESCVVQVTRRGIKEESAKKSECVPLGVKPQIRRIVGRHGNLSDLTRCTA